MIDGKTFKAMSVFGSGGEGIVVRYKSADKDVRAVKFVKYEEAIGIDSHRKAAAGELHKARTMTQDNALSSGFTDYVEFADETIALIGEPLPNGDLNRMSERMHANLVGDVPKNQPVPHGKITPFEKDLIALTLIKDAAAGLAVMNEEKDAIHGDMKSQNVMIDRDGKARVIDFGKSAKAREVLPMVYSFPDAPFYRAPEVMRNQNSAQDRFGVASGDLRTIFNLSIDNILDGFKTKAETKTDQYDHLRTLVRTLGNSLENFTKYAEGLDAMQIDKSRYDSYGLGTVAVELAVGGWFGQDLSQLSGFETEIYKEVDRWAQTDDDALGPNGLRKASSGDPVMDRFLNDMLRPKPEDRLSTTEIRDHVIMSRAGVGSPEVRNLIKALAGGNPTTVDQARDALRNRFLV